MDLRILCAGAAQGLVLALARRLSRCARARGIDATFGAVGTLREKLDAGEPCDAVILTALR